MTVGELNRALEPFFKVADQALKMRDLLKVAQETEEAVATLRQARDRAVLEADKAKAEAEAQQGHLADAKRATDQEAERYRRERIEALERQREAVRLSITRLNEEAAQADAKRKQASDAAAVAERDHKEGLQAMRREEETERREIRQRIAVLQQDEAGASEALEAKREAYRDIVERIAALAPR